MGKIFLSYSRQNEAAAVSLAGDLHDLGHEVWLDQEMSGGQVWWEQILSNIRDCEVFILVLSPEALDSDACRREIGYAQALDKSILPVLVDEGVSTNLLPPQISKIELVDYRAWDHTAGLRLAGAFHALPPPKALPKPLPASPEMPVSRLGGLRERIETSTELSFEKQSALLVELEGSLADEKTAADARTLLEAFRKRADLLSKIGEEIDRLLAAPYSLRSAPTDPAGATPTWRERGLGALSGGAIGTALGLIAALLGSVDWLFGLLPGTGGAIAGAISGAQRLVTLAYLAGAVFGCLSFATHALLYPDFWEPDLTVDTALIIGFIFGTFPGSVLGAIVGVAIERRHSA